MADARKELVRMQASLRRWLHYRALVDAAAAGTAPSKYGPAVAQAARERYRDPAVEQALAQHLYTLLAKVIPAQQLPLPTMDHTPQLAQLALELPTVGPQAQGAFYTNPLLMGLLLGSVLIFRAIGSWADVAKEREHYACIKAGACTDTGFWLKAGVIGVGTWLAWNKTPLLDFLKGKGKKTLARRR